MPKPRIPNQRKANIEHKKRTERYVQLIQQVYDRIANEAARRAAMTGHDPNKPFSFDDYPETQEAIKQLQTEFISNVGAIIMSGTSAEWKESNLVQDLVAKKVLTAYTGTSKDGEEFTRYFETNAGSLKAFQQRRDNGMRLSDRVWNLSEQYKAELETAIESAIAPGISAQQLSLNVRKFLNEPDLMFRRFRYKDDAGHWKKKWKKRVTDEDGNIRFIDCDRDSYRNQWTGPGYYKSSYKNAMRLARTEINMAYRTAEQERWKQFDFVVGYEVKTTKNGKHETDICDDLAGKYPKTFHFVGWHPHCYDEESQVLTNRGWLYFKDILDDDLILSLNPATRHLEWVSILSRQCYDHDGEMIRFFNKSLDCLVTPEHRMVYLNKSNGDIKYREARDYDKHKGGFYRGCEYHAWDKDYFILEDRFVKADDFCEFMGYYLADGSLQHGTGVIIVQKEGEPARDAIISVAERMGYNPKANKDIVAIYNSALNRYLSQFGICVNKYVPQEIKTASKRQIRIFLDAFRKCDGYTRPCKSFVGNRGAIFYSDKEERMYFTTSERLAGDLSELILKVGNRPSFYLQQPTTTVKKNGSIIKSNYICYRISECYSTTATVFNKETIQYTGKVYDLSLAKNHIMYIRRNGKCFWGSNCMCYCIPILKTEDEFWSLDDDAPSKNEVTDVPQGFKDWVADNQERIERAAERGKLPYFLRDNQDEVDKILYPEKVAEKPAFTLLPIEERAAIRHANRTQEEIDNIQRRWNQHEINVLKYRVEQGFLPKECIKKLNELDTASPDFSNHIKSLQSVAKHHMERTPESIDKIKISWDKRKTKILVAEMQKIILDGFELAKQAGLENWATVKNLIKLSKSTDLKKLEEEVGFINRNRGFFLKKIEEAKAKLESKVIQKKETVMPTVLDKPKEATTKETLETGNIKPVRYQTNAQTQKQFEAFLKKHGIYLDKHQYKVENGHVVLGEGAHKDIVEKYEQATFREQDIIIGGKRGIGNNRHGYIATTNYRVINGCLRDTEHNGKYAATSKILKKSLLNASTKDKYGKVRSLNSLDIETIQTLDSVIDRNSLPFPIRVIRNMDFDGVNALFGNKLKNNRNIDIQIKDRLNKFMSKDAGFMSTSTIAEDNVFTDRPFQLRINIPKGHKLYLSEHYAESELVLERLAQLCPRKITKSGNGYIIDCDVM